MEKLQQNSNLFFLSCDIRLDRVHDIYIYKWKRNR